MSYRNWAIYEIKDGKWQRDWEWQKGAERLAALTECRYCGATFGKNCVTRRGLPAKMYHDARMRPIVWPRPGQVRPYLIEEEPW